MRALARRLAADAVFPAGVPGHTARTLTLAGGERVRVVEVPRLEGDAVHPPVVCIHGWGCSAYVFHALLAPVAALGARAVALDLRGHGWSSKPLRREGYAPAALVRWLADVLDALGIERAVLLGHSMGGAIAVQAALDVPDRVAGLVLAAPVGFGTVHRIAQLRRVTPAALVPLLPFAARRALVAAGLRLAFGRIGRATIRDVDEYWAPTADPDLARAARLLVHADDWSAFPAFALARVHCPTALVLGALDHLVPVDEARARAAALPHHTVDVVAEAGHLLTQEVPARVLAAVAQVLAEAERADGAAAGASERAG